MTRLTTFHPVDRGDTTFLIGAILVAILFAFLLGWWLGFGKVLWMAGSTVAVLLVIGLLLNKASDSG